MEAVVKYIFLFLISTTVLNFLIAVGARLRVKTDSKRFNILIVYWVSLFATYFAAAIFSGSEDQIAFVYFLQVLPTFLMTKMLKDSRKMDFNFKFFFPLWAAGAVTSSLLILASDVGFTLSLIPVTIGTTAVYLPVLWDTLVKNREMSNWIEKAMAWVFITGIVNHFNYALFRLTPGTEWWGWSVSLAQYQCLSIFMPLLINHQRAENERKKLEMALEKVSGQHHNYSMEIDDLYRNLELQILEKEALNRKLQSSNESLEEERSVNEILIKTVSHDLANPLTVINAYTTMLSTGTTPEAEREVLLKRMQNNVNSALDMISRIRNAIVNRTQASLLTLQNVSIEASLNKLLDTFDSRIKEKNINLIVENNASPDGQVIAEENALIDHIFANILSNAIKFSNRGADLKISITEGREHLKVEFKDNGQGIAPHRLQKNFLSSTPGTEGEAGSGFGVMVMGYFLRKFEGKHFITSEGEGKGTTVAVYLKRAEVLSSHPAPSLSDAHLYS